MDVKHFFDCFRKGRVRSMISCLLIGMTTSSAAARCRKTLVPYLRRSFYLTMNFEIFVSSRELFFTFAVYMSWSSILQSNGPQ